jgi:hypothetical protein
LSTSCSSSRTDCIAEIREVLSPRFGLDPFILGLVGDVGVL